VPYLLGILLAILTVPALAGGEHRVHVVPSFEFESGATVPEVRISYVTHGTLNADKSNVVLVPSWYSGDHHGYDYLIGPGLALDPTEYFIVATDMFANGLSSSPSNTPPPFDGPRFPEVAIRDNVRAAKLMLEEVFGISHLAAVIGFSMGAQQALQWAVSYPDAVDHVVAFCGNAREYPFGYVRLEGAKAALTADAAWNGGDYTKPPVTGLRALSRHWAAWGTSQDWWTQEVFRETGADSIEEAMKANDAYILGLDANNLLWQAVTWQNHDVADTPGFDGDFEAALASIQAKVLLMPSATDLYFPAADAEREQKLIPGAELSVIPTVWGHDVYNDPASVEFLNSRIAAFLAGD
jgi:homoserine O-acetyltransferase